MAEELKIKLSADSSEAQKALDQVQKKSEDLKKGLETAATASGIAFAGLTAVIYKSIDAYAEQERAVNKLNTSLKNQGIFSEALSKRYQDQASRLQELTTYGDEAIISAQAQLQSYLRNKEVTEELTKATLDFASAQGVDLQTAASLVGKAIGSNVNGLARYGIAVNTASTSSDKLQQVISGLNSKFGGQAAALAQGLGSLTQLKNTVGDVFEEIGKRLTPSVVEITKKLNEFFNSVKNNPGLLDFITSILKIGTILSGSILTVTGTILAFQKFASIASVVTQGLFGISLGVKGLLGASGIGLLIVLVTDLALNWQTRINQMQAIFLAFTQNIGKLGSSLGDILIGVFTLDKSKILSGLEGAKKAFLDGISDFNDVRETQKSEDEKTEQEKQIALLNAQQEGQQKRLDSYTQFLDTFKSTSEYYQALNDQERADFDATSLENVQTQLESESSIRSKYANDALKRNIAVHNQFLQDQIKYGAAYASINKFINSQEIQDKKQTFSDLAQLTQSGNATLRGIGKASSLIQIGIKTAEGAISAYAALAGIPIVGPFLGAAAAAALIAFGGEQAAKVLAAQEGGLVTGGIPGRDSVPALLTPGEIVTPARNFDEVVNSVANSRLSETDSEKGIESNNSATSNTILIGFDGPEASQVLTARQNEDSALGISRAR